jgi:hypothetical protein
MDSLFWPIYRPIPQLRQGQLLAPLLWVLPPFPVPLPLVPKIQTPLAPILLVPFSFYHQPHLAPKSLGANTKGALTPDVLLGQRTSGITV